MIQQSIESFPRENDKTRLKLLLLRISKAGYVVEFEYSIIPIERSIGNVHKFQPTLLSIPTNIVLAPQ